MVYSSGPRGFNKPQWVEASLRRRIPQELLPSEIASVDTPSGANRQEKVQLRKHAANIFGYVCHDCNFMSRRRCLDVFQSSAQFFLVRSLRSCNPVTSLCVSVHYGCWETLRSSRPQEIARRIIPRCVKSTHNRYLPSSMQRAYRDAQEYLETHSKPSVAYSKDLNLRPR